MTSSESVKVHDDVPPEEIVGAVEDVDEQVKDPPPGTCQAVNCQPRSSVAVSVTEPFESVATQVPDLYILQFEIPDGLELTLPPTPTT